jgi:hypothetical protein
MIGRTLYAASLLLLCSLLCFASDKSSSTSSDKSKSSSTSDSGDDSSQKGQGGITGGGFSIESEMLAYKALNADSDQIAGEVVGFVEQRSKANNNIAQTVVIVTSQDLAGFLEWRSDLGQMQMLTSIAQSVLDNPVPLTPPATGGGGGQFDRFAFIGSIGDVQTAVGIVKDLASVAGTIKDVPFMHNVARKLKAKRIRVLIPSEYSPNLLGGAGISRTILFSALQDLDEERRAIATKLASMADDLKKADDILKTSKNDAEKQQATAFKDYAKTLAYILHAIDSFRASLFVGSGSGSPTTDKSQNSKAPDNSKSPPSKSASDDGQPNATTQVASSGIPFGRLLTADLLARGILGSRDASEYDTTDFSDVHLLTLQTLESGGGVLTRGGMFKGNRVNFSGGAATTFSLFDLEDGSDECSGNAYAYSGYFQQDDFATHFRDDQVVIPSQLTKPNEDCLANTDRPLHTWRSALKKKHLKGMNITGEPETPEKPTQPPQKQ